MRKMFTLALGFASALAFAQPQSQRNGHPPVLSVSHPTPQQLDSLHEALKEYYSPKEKSSLQLVQKRDSIINETYDTIASKWNPTSMTKMIYNKYGSDSIITEYSFNQATQTYRLNAQYVFTYNEKGQEVLRVYSSYDFSKKEWYVVSKDESTYEADGDLSLYLSSLWDTVKKAWTPSYKYNYSTNAEGFKLTTYANYNTSSNKWIESSRNETKYSDNKSIYRSYTKNSADTAKTWVLYYGYEYNYTYEEDIIQKIEVLSYSIPYGSTKLDSTFTVEIYTSNAKNQTTSIEATVNSILRDKHTFTYDEKGKQLTDSAYIWDTVNKKWTNYMYSTNTYDDKGNQTSQKSYNYIQGKWELSHEFINEYDSKNRNYEWSYKYFYGSTSQGDKYANAYNDNDDIVSRTTSRLIGGRWILAYRELTYYSAKDIIVINPTTEAEGTHATKPCLFPSVTSGSVKVKLGEAARAKLIIANASGKTMVSKSVEDGEEIELTGSGQFFYRISTLKTTESGVILKP